MNFKDELFTDLPILSTYFLFSFSPFFYVFFSAKRISESQDSVDCLRVMLPTDESGL